MDRTLIPITGSTNRPVTMHQLPTPGPLGTKPAHFKHVHQFVEVTTTHKNQLLLNILRHLMAHHLQFPNFKMIVYVNQPSIQQLLQMLSEALGPLLPLAIMGEGMSVAKRVAFLQTNFKSGVLLVTKLVVPVKAIPYVNFIVNYDLPINASSLCNTYLQRLQQLTLDQRNTYVINLFTDSDYSLTNVLISMFKKMEQPMNPLLNEIQKKLVEEVSTPEITNFVRTFVAGSIGNLRAFYSMTSSLPFFQVMPTAPVLLTVVPSSVVETPAMEFGPDQASFEDAKTTYFFEVLSESQKFEALKKVLEAVMANLSYARFKMVVVVTEQSAKRLEQQLRESFKRLPIKRGDSQFVHGVFLYELTDKLRESSLAIPSIDILVIYNYRQNTLLEEVLQIAKVRTDKSYAITFVAPDLKLNAKKLLSHLRDHKKTVDTVTSSNLQKIIDGLLGPELIESGNLGAFIKQMSSETLEVVETVPQFVEVLSAEEKPSVLLELIQTVFAEATALESYRMLVCAASVSLTALEGFLRSGLKHLHVPLLSIEADSLDHKTVFDSFHSGVLLVAEQGFRLNHLKFGLDPVNFVVNCDYSADDTEEGCAHFDYLDRLSLLSGKTPAAVLTFITKQNVSFAEHLVTILQKSKQPVNPFLLQIMTDPDAEKTFSLLKANTERLVNDVGNFKAFVELLQAQQPAELPIVTTITTPKPHVTPSVSKPSFCLQFAERIRGDQKMVALLDLLKYILKYFTAESFKIVVFIRGLVKERVQSIDSLLRDGLAGVHGKYEKVSRLYGHCKDPPSVIQFNFKLFVEMANTILFTDVDSRFLGFNKSDFVIFYEPPNDWDIYLDTVHRFKPANLSVFYLLTFLPETECQLTKKLIKMRSLADLRTVLRAPVVATANRLQFVEVLPTVQKEFIILHLTQRVLELWTHGQLKVLVFARGLVPERVKQFEDLLQAEGVSCLRFFAPCTDEVAPVQQKIQAFESAERAIMITDIDSRYVGVDAADFVIFYDAPRSLEVYLDALSRFQPVNSSQICFVTFVATEESGLPLDLAQMFGKINQEILPKTTDSLTSSTKTKNVAALLEHLAKSSTPPTEITATPPLPVQQLQFTPQSLKPKNECLQYIEVLTIDEKIDKLLDLFNYMATLSTYAQLKIVVFFRGLTKERTEQFDNLLKSDFKLIRRRFAQFCRFYAYVQCAVEEIQLSLRAFADCTNGVLITDVDSRYLGVNTADFIVFYDSPNSPDIYMDSLNRFYSENSSHTNFVTFLLASDCNLTKALPGILNEFNHPANPLIYKLIDRVKNRITDSAIREIRKTIKTGNLYALFKSEQRSALPAPYTSFTQLMRKFPACMINWLMETTGAKPGPIQSHVWPVMFSKMDLLAIAPNSEERVITFVLAAVTWIINEYDKVAITDGGVPHPIVVIFASSEDSVKQIQALIKLLGCLLASNGNEVYLNELILVERPVQVFRTRSDGSKYYFGNCKYVVFDEFDKMMSLGYIEEVAEVLLTIRDEKLFDGDVCLNIFSSVFSAFEKLVSLEFLENYHYFNYAEVTGQPVAESRSWQRFLRVPQYVEVAEFNRRRLKSLCSLLKRIMATDGSERFAVIVYLARRNDYEYLFAVYNKLLVELPSIAKQIFYNKKDFVDETEREVFWHHFKAQRNQIFVTNNFRDTQRVQHVKYVINFDFPTGLQFAFEYLQRMTNITCKNAAVISFFGLDDFAHSDVFVELLLHMKQKINPLLYEMKIVTELENTSQDMFNDELKRSILHSTNDLMEFVTNLMRTKRQTRCLEDEDRASTSSGTIIKRFRNAE